MPRFQYVAKEDAGATQQGVLEAESVQAATERLRSRGWFPVRVEPCAEDSVSPNRFTVRRVRIEDRNIFFRQLGNLLAAGMPLPRALNTIQGQTASARMRPIAQALARAVEDGASFAEALESQSRTFPRVYSSLVRAGESGGQLEEAVWRVVRIGEQQEDLRGKAFTALVYPAFLLALGSAAVFILVSFVFPRFAVVFEDFNAKLPLPTRITVALCDFMAAYWWAVLLTAVGTTAALWMHRRTVAGRVVWDRLSLRVPVLGDLVRRFEMAKFARTLGALFDNGVPVLQALEISGATLSNAAIQREIDRVVTRVHGGSAVSAALEESAEFPPLVVNMLAVGEEGGRLGDVTNRVADAYDVEVERGVKALTALLEPTLIVIMGVVIGFLVISMLLPMLTLSTQVR